MNTIHNALAKAAAIVVLASFAGSVAAAGNQTINVSATVQKVCKFVPGAALAMTFAAIDPSTTGDKTASVDVPFKCTNGTADTTITRTSGGTSLVNGGDSMTYAITIGAIPNGAGFAAAATNVTVTGTIADTQYRDAKALTYTDTVVLTINN